jgi:hypothetical protein
MTQNEVNRQVARITGETVSEINRRGFNLVEDSFYYDPEEYTIDWEELGQSRNVPLVPIT